MERFLALKGNIDGINSFLNELIIPEMKMGQQEANIKLPEDEFGS